MHVWSKFTTSQQQVNWAICTALNSLLLEIAIDLKSCGDLIKYCWQWKRALHDLKKPSLCSFDYCSYVSNNWHYFFFLFLTKLFIFYPVAVTLFVFPSEILRLFIFKSIPPHPQEYLLVAPLVGIHVRFYFAIGQSEHHEIMAHSEKTGELVWWVTPSRSGVRITDTAVWVNNTP